MLDQLLETKRATQRKPVGTVVSVVLHALVIAAATALTHRTVSAYDKPLPFIFRIPIEPKAAVPVTKRSALAPAHAPSPFGSQQIQLVVDIPLDIPPVDLGATHTDVRDWTGVGATGGTHTGTGDAPVHVGDQPYFDFQVEKAAAALPGSPAPAYPEQLKAAGVEGEALVQFVVDTLGRAELGSFKVLRSSHDAFAQAVRTTLPRMRFLPAEIDGTKVRMVVQQSFGFALNR